MESRTHLDHVLFQLTPTRTRCDLVMCAGNTNEKLASGLLEPFVSHLKSAKDQIFKGGYSITLLSDASWFTKATLERFVRFVSTPEVLERFVKLEREIQQIEKSIQSNEMQNIDVARDPEGNTTLAEGNFKKTSSSTKSKGEQNESGDGNSVPEENSKARLQRILETRSAVLRKEQAMAYARALVAGFDLEYLDDLISFANAFGALRLREACINFMELCKEKNEDRLWMDEIAAMQALSRPDLPYLATSGITLASDANELNQTDMSVTDSSTSHGSLDTSQDSRVPTTTVATDGKNQVPYPWQNNFQQYMNSFQGPVFPQMAPYPPGYAFPGMHVPPLYCPKWPPVENAFGRESDTRSYKSYSKNKKKHRKASEKVEEDEASESSTGSDSESDGEVENGKRHGKKHGKKSSRKVVIRNINYITSERDGERKGGSSEESLSDEDEFGSGDSLKRQVERAVGSFHRGKSSASNHQKKQESKKHHIKDVQEGAEEEKKNNGWGAFESLLMREEEENPTSSLGVELHQQNYISSKSSEVGVTKQRAVSDDSFVMIEKAISSNHSARFEESGNGGNIRRIQKKGEGTFEDLLFLQKSEKSATDISSAPDISTISSSTIRVQRDGDWFITDSLNKTASPRGNLDLKVVEADSAFLGGSLGTESKMRDLMIDDSFMVEGRETNEDHLLGSRSMADISMDVSDIIEATKSQKEISHANSFEPDEIYMMLNRDNDGDHAASAWTQEMIYESNNTSLTEVNRNQSESEYVDDSKVPPKDAKVKVLGKEVRSKTGSVGRSKPDLTSRTKNPSPGSRVPIQRGKTQKEEENSRRMEELRIQRQKRIAERSSNNGNTPGGTKRSTVETKVAKIPKKTTNQSIITDEPKLQKPPVLRNSTIKRLAAARVTKKVPPTNSKPASKMNGPKKMEGSKKKNGINQSSEVEKQFRKKGGQEKESAEVAVISSEEPTNQHVMLNDDFKDIKVLESIVVKGNDEIFKEQDKQPPAPPVLVHKPPTKSVQFKAETEISFISSPVSDTDNVRELTLHPEPSPPNLVSQTSGLELDMSTTPPEEQMPSRKKWNGDEKSPKTTKGFRKLLLFGKKSLNSLRN